MFLTIGLLKSAWPKYQLRVASKKYEINRVSMKMERSIEIFLTPADPDIKYGNITIPHVATQAEPLLKPRINESNIQYILSSPICSSLNQLT
jgi:hypothetical protein